MATTITTKAVLTINGKQVENTFQNVSREARSLERDLKKLTAGSKEYNEKWAELKKANQFLDEHKKKLSETKKIIQENTETYGGFKSIMTGFVAADFLSGAIQNSIQFGQQIAQRVQDLQKIKSELSKIDANLSGTKLDQAAAKVQAIIDTYGKSADEIKTAVKGLNTLTGDTNKSLELINKGFAAGADVSGEFLTQLKEYPSMMADAKVTAEEMVAIIAQSEKMGIYDDKGIDAIKEAMLRLREGTKATKDAMVALGIDVEDVYAKIADGNMTYFDLMKLVSAKIKETGANSRITGTAIADIFGGPGEDAGFRYISMLSEMDTNLNHLTESTDTYTDAKNQELEANKRLNEIWVSLTGAGSALSLIYTKLKLGAAELLASFLGIKQMKLSDEYLEQANRLDMLNLRLSATNITQQEKVRIYAQLKSEFPSYFKNLDLEKMKHEQIAAAIRSASNEMRKKYQLQALQEGVDEQGGEFKDASRSVNDATKYGEKVLSETLAKVPALGSFQFKSGTVNGQLAEIINYLGKDYNDNIQGNTVRVRDDLMRAYSWLRDAITVKNKEYSKLKSELAFQQKQIQSLGLQDVALDEGSPTSGTDATGAPSIDKNLTPTKTPKTPKDKTEKYKSESEAARKAEIDAYWKAEEEKLKIKQDSLDKDLELQKLARAKEHFLTLEENRKLNAEIDQLEQDKKSKNYSASEIADLQKTIDSKRKLIVTNNEIDVINEQTHQLKLRTIREKWDAKNFEDFAKSEQARIEQLRRADEDVINNISTMEEAELALSKMKYLKLTDQELKGIKNLEDAKRALREDADRKTLAAQLESLELQKKNLEEALKGITGEAAEKLKENLEMINTAITKVKGSIAGGNEQDDKKVKEERNNELSKIDILGFSAKDWQDAFNNLDTTKGKLELIGMAFKALSEAGKMFADLQRSIGERDLKNFERLQERKKQSLTKQLNEGYITNEEYNKRIEKLEKQTANKKAELEYKQAKADKISRMFAVIGNTAVGIAAALPNIPLSIIVGALGAVQLATVAAQPLPEKPSYATGGFTGSGYGMPDESGYKPAGIVHEREYVIPEVMTSNPRYANVISWLENERLGRNKVTSFAEGGSVTENASASNSTVSTAMITGEYNADIKVFLAKNIELLEYLIENGVHIEESMQNAKKLEKMQKEWNELTSKNKY